MADGDRAESVAEGAVCQNKRPERLGRVCGPDEPAIRYGLSVVALVVGVVTARGLIRSARPGEIHAQSDVVAGSAARQAGAGIDRGD